MFEAAGVDTVLMVEVHSPQIEGFFDERRTRTENVSTAACIAACIRASKAEEVVVVSPDVGGIARAAHTAQLLDAPYASIYKQRRTANEVANMALVGSVAQCTAWLVDDVADTCNTLLLAAERLCIDGAARCVCACVTQGVFSGDAVARVTASPHLTAIVVTNAVTQCAAVVACPKIAIVDAGALVAACLRRHMSVG